MSLFTGIADSAPAALDAGVQKLQFRKPADLGHSILVSEPMVYGFTTSSDHAGSAYATTSSLTGVSMK